MSDRFPLLFGGSAGSTLGPVAGARDHYQVLGVSRGADTDEIRRAHRKLIRVMHPDRHVQASTAEQQLAERRMREINEAWQTLSDPNRRSSYDMTLRAANTNGSTRPRSNASTGSNRPRQRASGPAGANGSNPGHRPTSKPGHGAYWSTSSSPRKPSKQARASGADAGADTQEIGAGTYFLLRKGPLVTIIAVVLGLFVVTALISGRGNGETTAVIPEPLGACVVLDEDSSDGYLVDCSQPNDGEVVALVEQPLDCPGDTRFVQVGTEFVCIPVPLGG